MMSLKHLMEQYPKNVPEDESAEHHQPKRINQSAACKNDLADQCESHVYHRAQPNSKDAVQQESTDEAEDDVRPGIYGVQQDKRARRHLQVGFKIVLQRPRIVEAKIRA